MNFTPRFTRPESGNPYYNNQDAGGYAIGIMDGDPLLSGCNTLANCVGYAAGRFEEILGMGRFVYWSHAPNPKDFVHFAKERGLEIGEKPKLGAILAWTKHVAVVEQINEDGSITTSESGYGCTNPFWTTARIKGDNGQWCGEKFGQFLGFIYQPKGASMKKGIDISAYQSKIEWPKVTASFVIARAGFGTTKDTLIESHYSGAKSCGIPIGAYWYSYAMTEDEARKEADACIAVLSGKKWEYPIFYDVEENKQFALGKEKVSSIMRAFLERVEAAGYWVGLYGSYSSLTTYTAEDIRKRYAIWLAHWDVDKSPYSGAYGVWQYKVGKADGVTGDCDLDYSYIDYPAIIKAKGLNGFGSGKPPETDDKDTLYVEVSHNGVKYAGTISKV